VTLCWWREGILISWSVSLLSCSGSSSPRECLTVKMKIMWSFRMSEVAYPMTMHNILEDSNLQQLHCKNLKSPTAKGTSFLCHTHTHTHINHISQSTDAATLQTTISLLKVKLHVINKTWSVQSGDCAVYCGKNVMTFWRNKVRPLWVRVEVVWSCRMYVRVFTSTRSHDKYSTTTVAEDCLSVQWTWNISCSTTKKLKLR
jgi:hypothetical protein